MALEGTFKDFHVADIVQLVGLQRKTGILTLEGEEDTLSLTFQEGAVVWVQSTRAPWDQRITGPLLARGLIKPAQLQEALTLQKETGQKLSSILAEKGFLQKKEWDGILAQEVEDAIYRPFRWPAGRYRFVSQQTVDPAEGRVGPHSAESILMEGIRRVDEWPMIRERVPSTAMVFKVGSRAVKLIPKNIEPGEVKMLDLVDGKRTVQELVDASGLGEFEAMRSLAGLVGAGAIAPTGPIPVFTPDLGTVEVPDIPAPTSLPARAPAAPPRWLPWLAWALAGVWLLAMPMLLGVEPLGLIPLSSGRAASLDRVRIARAQADLGELVRDLERYVAATGGYPVSLEVLATRDPSLGRRLQDPWGHPYQFRRTQTGASVFSAGPDGRVGTSDDLSSGDG
ncbi:MAG TPA: DUF4388 domain-containing protein [Candidatus Methylomirabilis sp.]|nr:DUF4388 domain-containing protein [Candidatus Methylomirabilis sp.]